ncbi:hypothetical protein BGE01nite_11960 [Brevifollis gellanilyticus]|uniref:Uncharacterized protein n=1 Tax=Brevifollis gellanilyticus TaxID=748831 RepID=A0A512M591_9BACT|nr:hypothetical protein BGE01nite_11960 [Brevifollis gellanilyticus]
MQLLALPGDLGGGRGGKAGGGKEGEKEAFHGRLDGTGWDRSNQRYQSQKASDKDCVKSDAPSPSKRWFFYH